MTLKNITLQNPQNHQLSNFWEMQDGLKHSMTLQCIHIKCVNAFKILSAGRIRSTRNRTRGQQEEIVQMCDLKNGGGLNSKINHSAHVWDMIKVV